MKKPCFRRPVLRHSFECERRATFVGCASLECERRVTFVGCDSMPMAGDSTTMAGDSTTMAGDSTTMAGDSTTMAGDLSPASSEGPTFSGFAGDQGPTADQYRSGVCALIA